MKRLQLLTLPVIIALFLSPFCLAHAEVQEGSGMKHPGSTAKEAEDMSSKPPYCKPAACMKVMLKNREDRELIVEEVLKDEATRRLLIQRIAANPGLRKERMQKMKERKQGESGAMKHEDMMHGEGSMMKREGSASK